MSTYRNVSVSQIPEPGIARVLFADVRMSWLWLLVRLYAGYEWLAAGWEKLTGRSIAYDSLGKPAQGGAWVFTNHDGAAIRGFVQAALAQAGGPHPSVQGWYATFLTNVVLPHARTFAYIITFGELLVGIALILGLLTGIAAFFGVFMNLNYLLAGTVSANPILGLLGILLVLAWRIAGFLGIDHWLLPTLGTPWTGSLRKRRAEEGEASLPPPVLNGTAPQGPPAGPPTPGETEVQGPPVPSGTAPQQVPAGKARDSSTDQTDRGS